MKRKVSIDKNRARALFKMSQITLERLSAINKLKYPSNTLDDYYDILHQLVESLSLLKGVKFSKDFAHKNLINWASEELGLSSIQRDLLQQIRSYRNKISYEGFNIMPEYIRQNESEIMKIISIFRERLKAI